MLMASASPSPFGIQAILKAQYDGLGRFIEQYAGNTPRPPNDKPTVLNLSGITMRNLEELAADLSDEVARRQAESSKYIPATACSDYTAERNQARQRLAACKENDLRYLVKSLRYELERRYPEFKRVYSITSTSPTLTETISPASRPAAIPESEQENSSREGSERTEANLAHDNEVNRGAVQHAQRAQFELFKAHLVGYQLGETRDEERRARFTELLLDQFADLASDVYDELVRRRTTPEVTSLPEDPSYPFKRNQARVKLSKLGGERLKKLVADIFYEMLRRFPSLRSCQSRLL